MPFEAIPKEKVRSARLWLLMVVAGIVAFVIGVAPQVIGMNRSQVIGFVQIGVWLLGLAVTILASFIVIRIFRNRRPLSLRADIGMRLIATGYVVSATASLADFIGVGAQRMPAISFGPLQVFGLVIGIVTSVLGLFLYWPRTHELEEEASPQEKEHE